MTLSNRDWWNSLAASGKDWPGQFKRAIKIQYEPSDADLERMLALAELTVEGSKVLDDVRPLAALKKLKKLTLPQSVGIQLEALPEATALSYLDLNGNYLTDAGFLKNLPRLKTLKLDGNRLEDLSPLAGLQELEVLSAPQNKITDLTPLRNLMNLKILNIRKNSVTSLEPLAGLPSLRTIWADENPIADLNGLDKLENLEELGLGNTKLRSLKGLLGFSKLRTLDLSGIPLESVAGIENLRALVSLRIGGPGLTDLGWVKEMKALDWLWLRDTKISRLEDLTGLPVLRNFLLYTSAPIDVTPLASCRRLAGLSLDAPDVRGIEALAKCRSLKSFQVSDHLRDIRKKELRALAKLRNDITLNG